MSDLDKKHWLNFLEDEDVAFVKRFILFTLSGMRCSCPESFSRWFFR